MKWSYRVAKENDKYGIVEAYFHGRYLIGYTEFLSEEFDSKQKVIMKIKKLLAGKVNMKKAEDDESIKFGPEGEKYSKAQLRSMINDSLKSKVIEV